MVGTSSQSVPEMAMGSMAKGGENCWSTKVFMENWEPWSGCTVEMMWRVGTNVFMGEAEKM